MLRVTLCVLVVWLSGHCRADLPPVFSDLTLEAASKQVEGTEKIVLMKFTAEWCMPCKAMDQTTWRDEKVVEWVKQNGLAIQVDVDKQPSLARKYQVAAMPTMVMLRGGNEIARKPGYLNADDALVWLEKARAGTLTGGPRANKDSRDMMERLNTARELSVSGKPDEATEEFVWLWKHMLEFQPAMVGVRGSFMASDMANLAARHTPAKAAFSALRDDAGAAVKADPADTAALSDWVVLNRIIGDEEATLAWFDRVKADPAARASLDRVSFRVVDLLVERDRWSDVAVLYADPIGAVRSRHVISAEMASHEAPLPESLDEATKQSLRDQPWTAFREQVAVLYTGFLAAGKDEEAAAILAEARRLYDKPKLITGVLGFAIEKGQARPAMRALLDEAEKAGADVASLRTALGSALANK